MIRPCSTAGFLSVVFGVLVVLTPAWSVPTTGRVLGPDDKPVAGAEVVVTLPGGVGYVTDKTNEAGEFTVETGAELRSYAMRAFAYVAGFAPGSAALPLKGPLDFRLRAAGTVSGIVQDEDGKPVADAIVELNSVFWAGTNEGMPFENLRVPEPMQSKFSTKSGADGRWTLSDVPTTGTAMLWLDDPQYVKAYGRVELNAASAVKLVAKPAAILTGKIVHEDGAPAAGIRVLASGATRSGISGVGTATTDEKGEYRLGGLASGSYVITTIDSTKQWVSVALRNVEAKEGATSQAADIVLTAGAIVQGTVTDAATGAPVAGVMLGSYGPHRPRVGGGITAFSDEQGRYTLRVAPGKCEIFVQSLPKAYPYEVDKPYRVDLEIAKGETKTADFRIHKGLSVFAKVVDQASRPVADVALTLAKQNMDEGRWVAPVTAKTDEHGKWLVEGLVPGTWKLSAGGSWQVAAPQAFVLPVDKEVQIRLRKLKLATVTGRVLDTNGQPVAGATITANIIVPPQGGKAGDEGSTSRVVPALTTDEQGAYKIPEVRPGSSINLLVKKAGYAYASGGKITEQAGVFNTKDVILAPLTARLEGTVVDAANAPVAGARVLCPGGGAESLATTDESGKFKLATLPAGEVTIIAARGNDVATVRAKTGDVVSLALKPRTTIPGRDLGRAFSVLSRAKLEALEDEEGAGFNGEIAAMLAPYSPDVALQLGTDFHGNLADEVVDSVVQKLVESDPVRAAMWAPDKIAAMQDASQRLYTMLNLGGAVAEIDLDLARSLYQQTSKLIAERPPAGHPMEMAGFHFNLWKMAQALNLPQAAEHRRAIIALSEQELEEGMLEAIAASVAEVDTQLAEKMFERVSEARKPQAAPRVIPVIARKDMPAALRLLDGVEKSTQPTGKYNFFGSVAQEILPRLAKTDAAAALALAKRVQGGYRASALVSVARVLPKAEALPLLKEAFNSARQDSILPPAQVAALVYDLDPQAGLPLFSVARSDWEKAKQNEDWDVSNRIALWAFYYSRVDPAEARIVLEQEFARAREEAVQIGATYKNFHYAGAMAAIDMDRAMEMFNSVPEAINDENNMWIRVGGLLQIAHYVLTPAAERFTMNFHPSHTGDFED